jgi:hypothetical protein
MAETAKTPASESEIPGTLLKNVVNRFKVGADPEFAVLDENSKLIFNAPPYEVDLTVKAGRIGRDHSGRIWELRPEPSHSAYQVVVNVWKLLNSKALDKIANFRWKSGGLAVPWKGGASNYNSLTLGGHVHFGFPTILDEQLAALAETTRLLEKLEILPSRECRVRDGCAERWGADFGKMGRRYSTDRVEYRAPASWLDRPGQALMCLTVLKLVANAPGSLTTGHDAKHKLLSFLDFWSQKDVDAWLVLRLIEKRGFEVAQASPDEDFKPNWRKEELWR